MSYKFPTIELEVGITLYLLHIKVANSQALVSILTVSKSFNETFSDALHVIEKMYSMHQQFTGQTKFIYLCQQNPQQQKCHQFSKIFTTCTSRPTLHEYRIYTHSVTVQVWSFTQSMLIPSMHQQNKSQI